MSQQDPKEPMFRVISLDGKQRSKPWARERILQAHRDGKLPGFWTVRSESSHRSIPLEVFLMSNTDIDHDEKPSALRNNVKNGAPNHLLLWGLFLTFVVPPIAVTLFMANGGERGAETTSNVMPGEAVARPPEVAVNPKKETVPVPVKIPEKAPLDPSVVPGPSIAPPSSAWLKEQEEICMDLWEGALLLKSCKAEIRATNPVVTGSDVWIVLWSPEIPIETRTRYHKQKLAEVTVEIDLDGLTLAKMDRNLSLFWTSCLTLSVPLAMMTNEDQFVPKFTDWLAVATKKNSVTTIGGIRLEMGLSEQTKRMKFNARLN